MTDTTVTIPPVRPAHRRPDDDPTAHGAYQPGSGEHGPDDPGSRHHVDGTRGSHAPGASSGGGRGDRSGRPDRRGPAGRGPRAEAPSIGRLDLRNTWQVAAGSILVPLGVVLIVISWYGSAHARVVQQQIPYLVSGSFLGLGCMVLGGLLYWAHWLYRLYDNADLHHEEDLQVMDQLFQVLAVQLAQGSGPAGAGARTMADGGPAPEAVGGGAGSGEASVSTNGGSRYVATLNGSVFHDVGCPVVEHHHDGLRVVTRRELTSMEPCRLCRPDGD